MSVKARIRRWLHNTFGAELHRYSNPKEIGWDGWLEVFGILVAFYRYDEATDTTTVIYSW